MKKAIIILSIFLTPFHFYLFAQSVELNEQNGQFSEVKKIQLLNNNRWLIGGRINELDNSLVYFSVIDTSKLLKSNTLLDGYEIKKIRTRDDLGFAWFHNENNGKGGLIKIEIDSNSFTVNGQIEFIDAEVINEVEILPNGKLIILGTKNINSEQRAFFKIMKNNFAVEYENYITPGYFDDILIDPNSNLMLVGRLGDNLVYGGKEYNWNYQSQGGIIELTALAELDDIFRMGGVYFSLKNQTISKLDNDFQIEDSINLESYGEIIDLEFDDEIAFLLFQNEEEASMILKINTELEVIDFFEVEDKYFRVNDMYLSDEEIGLGGFLIPSIPFNNIPFLYPSTSSYFKTFSKNGIAQDENIDLELIDVKVEDYEKVYTCGPAGLADVYLLNLKKIKVRMVNKGTTTINNVSLFSQAKGVENCVNNSDPEYYLLKEDLKMLDLDPGDTVQWRIPTLEFPQKSTDSTSVELCIWYTVVENQRDQNNDNNYFCGEVKLERPFEEFPIIKPKEEDVLIFPNPLNDFMTISLLQAPFEPTVIEFSDFLGRKLEQKYVIAPRAKYKEFDISQIPTGFHYVFITNDLISKGVLVYMN
ncbi:MAG: hypothetical protein AB8F94_01850 [Saprospiraceae bacterium]